MNRALFVILFIIGCAAAICAPRPVLRSAGTDFWVAFPNNDPNNPDVANLSVYITAETTAVVRTTMYVRTTQRRRLGKSWGYVPSYDTLITRIDTVQGLRGVAIPIDTINDLKVYGQALPYSVHITASAAVRVFTLSHKLATSDGVTALPTTLLDTEYIVIAHQTDPAGYRTYASLAAFIATEDSTYITVRPSAKLFPYQGSPFTIFLHKGQVYQIASDTNIVDADLTGTIVNSSKPCVVLGGVERTWVFSTGIGARSRDHVVEQMLPVKYFSRTFLAGPTSGKSPNPLRIVAAYDSTVVVCNDSTYVMQRGGKLEISISAVSILRATKPVLVVEDEPSSNSGVGDPDMTLVPPMRGYDSLYVVHCPLLRDTNAPRVTNVFRDSTMWRDTTKDKVNHHVQDTIVTVDSTIIGESTSYTIVTVIHDSTFLADSVYIHDIQSTKTYALGPIIFYENHLTAILRIEDRSNFLIDGYHPIGNLFKPTTYCGYLWFSTTIGLGTHVISAPHGFSLMTFGYGNFDSYAHVAGFKTGAEDSIQSEEYAFGKLRVRKTRDITKVVRNLGVNPVSITSASIVGRDAAFFRIIKDSIPATLQFNDSLACRLRFIPDTMRRYTAYLQLCTDISIVRIPLTGEGIASRLVLKPPVTNWGQRKSPARYDSTVVICNIGNDSVLVTGMFLVLHDTTLFSIDSVTFTLQPGDCRTLRANFHPRAAGSYAADIRATSDSPFDSIVGGMLLASSLGQMLFVDSIDFGTRLLGSAIVDSQAFILNGSNAVVVRIDSLSLLGANASMFSIRSPLRSAFPKYLAAGETLWVQVSFTPNASVRATANIVVHAPVPCDDILLTGNVIDIIRPQLGNLNLDTLCVNSAIDTAVTLRNLGTSPLSITRIWTNDSAAFSILAPKVLPVDVAAGSQLNIRLHAAPRQGRQRVTLAIAYQHVSDTVHVIASSLDMYGVMDSTAIGAVQRTSMVAVGDVRTFCITVRNVGDHAVTFDSTAVSDATHFRITGAMPRVIAPGDSICITYTFAPTTSDSVLATARVFAHGQCGSVVSSTMLIGYGQFVRVGIDSINFQQIYSCSQKNSSLTIRNLSPVDARITAIAPVDPTAPFRLTLPSLPADLPQGGILTIPVSFVPVISGAYATDILVTTEPNNITQPPLRARVSGQAVILPVVARIDSTHHALPGSVFVFPIRIDSGIGQVGLHTVRGTIGYNPRVMEILDHTTSGTALDGFIVDSFTIDNRRGNIQFRFHHPSITVTSNTTLLNLIGFAAVGDSTSTPLPLTLEFPDNSGACVALRAVGGKFSSDSVCGLGPVMYGGATLLSQNTPNPFSDVTAITFHTSNEGSVLLNISDQLGRIVRTLVNDTFHAGAYTVTLHADALPPGLYYYQLTASGIHLSKQMLLVR